MVPISLMEDRGFLALKPAGPPPDAFSAEGPVRFDQSIVRVDPEGEIRETLATYTVDFPFLSLRGGTFRVSVPLVPTAPLVGYDQEMDRVYRVERTPPQPGEAASFTVQVLHSDGTTETERGFTDDPRPFTAQVQDSLQSHLREVSLQDAPTDVVREVEEWFELPPFQPPVSRMGRGADGKWWLALEPFPDEGQRFLVLDQDLQPVARLSLPEGAGRLASPLGGTELWTLERGEWNVPYLVRYRIHRGEDL